MWFNSTEVLFQVGLQRSEDPVFLIQRKALCNAKPALLEPDGLDATVRGGSSESNEATRFLWYSIPGKKARSLPTTCFKMFTMILQVRTSFNFGMDD